MSASALQAIELPKSIPQRFPRAPCLRSLRTQRRRPRRKRRRSRSERKGPRGDAEASINPRRKGGANAWPRAGLYREARPAQKPGARAGITGVVPQQRLTLRRGGQAPRRLPDRGASRGPRAQPRAPRWAAPQAPRRRSRRPDRRTPRPVSGRRAPAPAGR